MIKTQIGSNKNCETSIDQNVMGVYCNCRKLRLGFVYREKQYLIDNVSNLLCSQIVTFLQKDNSKKCYTVIYK